MSISTAYCGVRDRNVCVVTTAEAGHEGEADLQSLAITCMGYAYGPICTGDFCPNFGDGRVHMGVRLAGHALDAAALRV